MMAKPSAELGTLKKIAVRDVFAHEPTEFTPWLAEHIGLLGDALGLDLEVDATEVDVGDFFADIVATDSSSGHPVIVENQLSPTDHSHLGQVLTYAAGKDASRIVWVAPQFRPEHREVLDWLNRNTVEGFDFFGVEMELLQVDDSLPAPHFNVVAQPNEWAKATRKLSGRASELGLADQRFFSAVLDRFKAQRPYATSARRVGTESWFGFSAGRSGFALNWSMAASGHVRVELYIDVGDRDANKHYFDTLQARATELETALGSLSWERMDQKKGCRIASYQSIDRTRPDEDPAAIQWAADMMARFVDTLRPIVKQLPSAPSSTGA